MKFRIIGSVIVVAVLIFLYVLTIAQSSTDENVGSEPSSGYVP